MIGGTRPSIMNETENVDQSRMSALRAMTPEIAGMRGGNSINLGSQNQFVVTSTKNAGK